MKKQIIALTVILVFQTSFFVAQARSKSASCGSAQTNSTFYIDVKEGNPVNVSTVLEKRFKKQFPQASLEQWYSTEKGFVVHFLNNDIQSIAYLDKKGNMQSQISYYGEKNLPAMIRQEVKSNYYDYSIRSVTEVTVRKAKVYLVNIEDETSWKTIRISDEGMDVYEEHTKG